METKTARINKPYRYNDEKIAQILYYIFIRKYLGGSVLKHYTYLKPRAPANKKKILPLLYYNLT